MLPSPKAALQCPGFVCGSPSPKLISQVHPRIFRMFPTCVSLLFPCSSDLLCTSYCLKNNGGHMSPLRHLVLTSVLWLWLFLLTRWKVEQSPDQPQSSCHPQVRPDNSAPYWDRDRRVLSGRNMNQMNALGFHFKRKKPLAASFVFGCMGGQAFH